MDNIELVYGFVIPEVVYLHHKDTINNVLVSSWSKYTRNTELVEYKISVKTFDNNEVFIGLGIHALNNEINLLEINKYNIIFNENAETLKNMFVDIFKPVIDSWANLIKKTADEFAELHKDYIGKDIEIPEIPVPGDKLEVSWYITHMK